MNEARGTRSIALLAAMALPLAGCQGVVWANMAVLGVTFGLFFGTLNLGRKTPTGSTKPSGSATQSSAPR